MSDYTVVLLVEQELTEADARQVRSLHEAMSDPVHYRVLFPVDDAAVAVESAMGTLGAGEVMPSAILAPEQIREIQDEILAEGERSLGVSISALTAAGADADGEVLRGDPVAVMIDKVGELAADEVIVLTRPHVVAEFFHLDWTSRARRKLGVPVLHLLEHENFDEQAGAGEGITGL